MARPVDTSSGPAQSYGVTITKEPGANLYTIRSENYDDVMGFMTDILSMSDSEADIEIGEEEDFDHPEDHFAAASREWEEAEAGGSAARTSGSGRPFEGKVTLKSLLEMNDPDHLIGRGPDDIVVDDEIEVGDLVDVETEWGGTLKVRVVDVVDDVRDATGYIENDPTAMPNDHMDTVFQGPGFVGDIDSESGESGELVFSLGQVVPNSKLKYSGVDYVGGDNAEEVPTHSDYFDEDGKDAATAWRARPFGEGKQMKSLKGVTTLKEALSGIDDDVCPMCGAVHTDTTTCDYEECGECGFDHSYEPIEAQAAHREMGHGGVNETAPVIDEADDAATPVSVADAVKAVTEARKNYAAAGRFTPFSNWYKGDHGHAFSALKKAVKALAITAKKGDDADKMLAAAAKAYYDSVAAKSSDGTSFSDAVKAWDAAKGSTPSPEVKESTDEISSNQIGENVSRIKMPIKENQGSHNFDRFMDKILVQESPKAKMLTEADSAQRIRASRHQERPAGRTRYTLKG